MSIQCRVYRFIAIVLVISLILYVAKSNAQRWSKITTTNKTSGTEYIPRDRLSYLWPILILFEQSENYRVGIRGSWRFVGSQSVPGPPC